ncbi:MAG: DUF805 domain-containing protein [Candidatus Shapirobacteria bacterium]|nr:DUF805 domain-containing protein [Candidatus Shapirobacteria bacterium]
MKRFFEGRLKRLNFFAAMLTVSLFFVIITFLVGIIDKGFLVSVILSIILYFFQTSIAARRLHDIGWNGYLSLIFLIPFISQQLVGVNLLIVNVVFILLLIFVKGNPTVNKYGEMDTEKDIFKVIFPRKKEI